MIVPPIYPSDDKRRQRKTNKDEKYISPWKKTKRNSRVLNMGERKHRQNFYFRTQGNSGTDQHLRGQIQHINNHRNKKEAAHLSHCQRSHDGRTATAEGRMVFILPDLRSMPPASFALGRA